MKKIFFLILFVFTLMGYSQENFTVFLVGDAGKDTSANENLLLLKKELEKNSHSAVVFLGDNIYPKGFLEKKNFKHELEKKRIISQLDIIKEHRGSAYFIPGNHDWRIGKMNGKKSVMQQGDFINKWCSENSKLLNRATGVFFPQQAKSGPVSVLLSAKLRLIMLDSQWWLQPFEADKFERNVFLMGLDSVLSLANKNGEKVIVAAHHPVFSNGRHAKKRMLARFLINYTPFQIFGLLGLNRLMVQDLYQLKYRKLRESLLKIFEKYPGVIYVSGHEHNLQVFKNKDDLFIVSGSGSKVTLLSENYFPSEFGYDKSPGFFRLDFIENGKVIISAFSSLGGKPEKIYNIIW